jgi:hypothetical protein
MPAGRLICQHVRQEQALVDLDALLVLERQRCFGRQFLVGGQKSRHELGAVENELLDAHEILAVVGKLAVQRFGVGCQELIAQVSLAGLD